MTSPHHFQARSFWLTGCLGTLCFLCFGLFAIYGLAELISPSLSKALVPVYPSSQIIGEEVGGGSGGRRETTIYHTADSITAVHTYMEAQLPGFQHTNVQSLGHNQLTVEAYANDVCNDTLLAHIVGTIIGSGFAHCASVILYTAPERPQETIVEVTLQYPSG